MGSTTWPPVAEQKAETDPTAAQALAHPCLAATAACLSSMNPFCAPARVYSTQIIKITLGICAEAQRYILSFRMIWKIKPRNYVAANLKKLLSLRM
jgi:hypothetical protein